MLHICLIVGVYSQQRLDIEVVGRKDNLKQHLLINSDELLIPLANVCRALARLVLALVGISCGERLATVMFAVLENLR